MVSIVKKIKENRLKWFGNILRKEEIESVRLVMRMFVKGKRGIESQRRGGNNRQ